jgi:hypothetical protein
MTDQQILYDPTAEHSPIIRPRIERPASLEGLTFGLLDIAKARGDVFLDRLEELLGELGHKVNRYRKERFSILAPDELQHQITAECDIVIEALAD